MKKKQLTPYRRFIGFGEGWQSKKIYEIADVNPPSVLPDIFKYVDLESVIGTSLVSCRTVNKFSAPSRAQRVAKYGDIFYQTVRPYQKNNYRFSLKQTNYVFSSGYAQLRPKINSKFLISKIITKDFVEEVLDRCTGTSFPAITPTDLSMIDIILPMKSLEQQKIGEFFKVLDDRIANQERKIAKVKALKTAYLTEMFPQEGETVPKRRFKGFEDEWERFKLEDLAEIKTGYAFKSNQFNVNGKYLVVTNKNIQGDKSIGDRIDIQDLNIINNYKLSNTNVLVTMDGVNIGETGKFSDENAVLAQRVGRLNSDQIEFVYQITKINKFSLQMHRISVGNAIKHISLKQIAEYSFYAPTSKEEQQKIGEFFKNLDNQIEMEEKKLDKLQKMKEAYLEEMFV